MFVQALVVKVARQRAHLPSLSHREKAGEREMPLALAPPRNWKVAGATAASPDRSP